MTVTRRITGHLFWGCRCRAAKQRGNNEWRRILHSGPFISLCHCCVEHEKLLTLSSPERHDHGASRLPAAIKPPHDILPAGRKLRRVHSQTAVKTRIESSRSSDYLLRS